MISKHCLVIIMYVFLSKPQTGLLIAIVVADTIVKSPVLVCWLLHCTSEVELFTKKYLHYLYSQLSQYLHMVKFEIIHISTLSSHPFLWNLFSHFIKLVFCLGDSLAFWVLELCSVLKYCIVEYDCIY